MAEQSLPKTTVPLRATDHIFLSTVPCAARPAERKKKLKKISQHISRPFVSTTTGWGSRNRITGHTNYTQAV